MNAEFLIETRSIPEPNTGCWLWLGGLTSAGYGAYGGGRAAHRLSYATFNGPIPDGLLVRHARDQPSCVNPGHLLVGTHDDNMRDKVSRGRAAGAGRGARHWNAALSADDVEAIRNDPRTQSEIGAAYGIRQQAVSKIKRGQTWRAEKGGAMPAQFIHESEEHAA